jgi:hypothetical protein
MVEELSFFIIYVKLTCISNWYDFNVVWYESLVIPIGLLEISVTLKKVAVVTSKDGGDTEYTA